MDYKYIKGEELNLKLVLKLRDNYYYGMHRNSDNALVGHCELRCEDNYDNKYLGNIGYEVFENYQGNNYAYKASELLGKLAYDLGMTKLKLTCRPNNEPSIRTIEKLPVKFIDVVKVPRDTVLYKQGDRYLKIYEWNLKKEGEKNDRHQIN